MSAPELPPVVQEREQVANRAIVRVALLTVGVLVVAIVVSTVLLGRDGGRKAGTRVQLTVQGSQHAPNVIGVVDQTLASGPAEGLAKNARAERALHEYGWVDRGRGLAHIPIDQAITLYVTRSQTDAGGAP